MTSINLNALRRQHESLEPPIDIAALQTLKSKWYGHREKAKNSESDLTQRNGRRHCIGVANGNEAIDSALRSVGVEAEGRAITVSNSGMYTTTACVQIGALAVVITHLSGYVADLEQIRAVIGDHCMLIIKDCAQTHGTVLTVNQPVSALSLKLRLYGWGAKYHSDWPFRKNSCLQEYEAAVPWLKLQSLDRRNATR